MFKKTKAFSGFAVDDVQKAKDFYGNTLGLTVEDYPMGLLALHIEGNNPMIVYPKLDHVPATFTILNFPVDDIEKAVDQLIEKGITFIQYTGQLATDEKGICWSDSPEKGPNIAWFKDPAGNILSVLEA